MDNENQFEELESLEKLDELMLKIQEARKMSANMQSEIDRKTQEDVKPLEVDAKRAELEALKKRKEEFDEMTENAVAQAKERLAAVRGATEKKFNEDLITSAHNRRNATEREDQFFVNEESTREEIQKKTETLKARAAEKALAKAKEIARQKGGTPEEMRQIEAEEAKRIRDEEFAKIDEIAARSLQKLEGRTLRNEKDKEYQTLIDNQTALRSKLDGYDKFLNYEYTDLAQVKKDAPELTAMQIYDKAKALRGELVSKFDLAQKRLAEIEEALSKGYDENLAKEKEELLKALPSMKDQIKACEDKIAEVKSKMSETERAAVEQAEKDEEAAKKKKEEEGRGEGEGGDGRGEGGNGNDKPLVVTGEDYYESFGRWGKYKLKKEAYTVREGISEKEVGLFRKLLLMLPSKKYSKLAQKFIELGDIKVDQERVDAILDAKREMQAEQGREEQGDDSCYQPPEARGNGLAPLSKEYVEATDKAARKFSEGAHDAQKPEEKEDVRGL